MSSVCRAPDWSRIWRANCIQWIHFCLAVRGAALGIIRPADWTELDQSVFGTLTAVWRGCGTVVRPAVAVMEGGVLMLKVVTTLNTCSFTVDKNKTKASSCQQPPQRQATQSSQGSGPPDVVPARATEVGRKDVSIQQLKGLLAASHRKFEAVAIVLQQTLAEVWKFYL